MVKKSKIINIIITLLLFIHVFSWVLYMPMAQIQMMIFGKRLVSFMHYGVIEIVLVIFLLLFNEKKIRLVNFDKNLLYLIFPFLISWMINSVRLNELTPFIILFYLMNWIFPILILIIINQYDYDILFFIKIMLVLVIVHAIIIIFQRLTNSIIWPFKMYDDGTSIFGIDTYYNVGNHMGRCPGMCQNGLDAGIFSIFGIVLTVILPDIKSFFKFVICVLLIFSIYFTGTRNVFVMMSFIIAVIILMRLEFSRKNKIRLLVLLTFLTCIIYLFFVLKMTNFETTGNVFTDTTSIGIRIGKWIKMINKITAGGILNFLFGVMQWQNAGNCEVIDNMYLELVWCSGIFSLFAYIKYIINIAMTNIRDNKFEEFVCAGFTLCYFVYGVLNSTSNLYLTLIILLFIFCNRNLKNKKYYRT